MRVAVTGGSGELGTIVLRRLCADRRVKRVISLDLRPPLAVCAKLEAVHADVRDPDLGRWLDGCDALFHFAFVVTGFPPRDVFDDINVGGTRNVITQAIARGVKRIVYSSSMAAYGVVPGHPVPIVEDTPRRRQPDFAYAAAKYDVEAFLDELEPAHPDVAIARLRPAILIGARMDHPLGTALRRRTLPDQRRSPLPVVWDEDVADAALLAMDKGARGAFNLQAADPLPILEWAKAGGMRVTRVPRGVLAGVRRLRPLLERAGWRPAFDPAWLGQDGGVMILSSDKARRELGWTPKCPTAVDVMRRYLETVPARMDPRLIAFFAVAGLAAPRQELPPEARHVRLTIHLCLTGPGGGDVTIRVEDGRLRLWRGLPRPPGAIVTILAATFLDFLRGRADPSTASMTGRIRTEGDPLAGMIVGALISTFRTRLQRLVGFA
jgi:UDP-glucose 4-epimerase